MIIQSKMASTSSSELDKWRDYFKRASSDIFAIIEHAIMVAATDSPQEFRVRREKIAELLFTCRLTRCSGCDRVELAVSEGDGGDNGEVKAVNKGDNYGVNADDLMGGGAGSTGSKLNSTKKDNGDNDGNGGDDGGDDDGDGDGDANEMINMINHEIRCSDGDAEALTDEIEEAKVVVNEVYRIKNIIINSKDESDSVLFESLRRLQLIVLNYDILKTTEIGKAVNLIRKHTSKKIRHLARVLIGGWRVIAEEWMKATKKLTGGTPDSINPSTIDEEEGLPSPPLDGVFFSTETMDFSKFFEGMDDDGNPRHSGEFTKNLQEAGRKFSAIKPEPQKRRQESPKQALPVAKDNKVQQQRRQDPLPKPSKPLNLQSGPGRAGKPNGELKPVKDPRTHQIVRKPNDQMKTPPQPEKVRSSTENTVQEKIESTKRKLQECYQQAENAKKQRTIQVMEIKDIPKKRLMKPNPFGKYGNNNRHRAIGRR